jgi:hypothetical protein
VQRGSAHYCTPVKTQNIKCLSFFVFWEMSHLITFDNVHLIQGIERLGEHHNNMEGVVATLLTKAECRTPIVVMREETPEQSDQAMVTLVQRVATRCDAYVEHIHAGKNDELTAVGKRIDTSIINGDWLVITFGKQFNTVDFLRFVGRRLFTIMPDPEKRPNMELFRLWLCLDHTIQLPLVFQKVALPLDMTVLSRSSAADDDPDVVCDLSIIAPSGPVDPVPSATTSATTTRPPTAPMSVPGAGRPTSARSAVGSVDDFEIPNDDTACDFEQQFESATNASNVSNTSKAVIGNPESKLGPLFYRRLELSAGRRPTSSSGRAAEIRNLRIQSAQLRSSAVKRPDSAVPPASARPTVGSTFATAQDKSVAAPHRPHTVSSTGRPSTAESSNTTQSVASHPVHATLPAQDAFEKTSSDVLQKLHGALIKSFVYSQEAAQRMLHTLLEFADNTVANTGNSSKQRNSAGLNSITSVETASLIPTHNTEGLVVGDVLRMEEGIMLRHGTWRHVEVLIEQMSPSQFASAWSSLARTRCRFKHPMVSSPLALLQDSDAQVSYLVYTFPARGPLASVLRRLGTDGKATELAARVVKCCAIGLQLLHNDGYVHRDISAQQFFDFGSNVFQLRITHRCHQLEADGACTAEGVTTRWTSPDALFTGRFYPEDDVWSIGIVVWEILSKCADIPYAQHVTKEEVAAALASGELLPCPTPEVQFHPIWTKVALPCFSSRYRRPSLSQIIAVVDSIISN